MSEPTTNLFVEKNDPRDNIKVLRNPKRSNTLGYRWSIEGVREDERIFEQKAAGNICGPKDVDRPAKRPQHGLITGEGKGGICRSTNGLAVEGAYRVRL